MSSIRTRVGKEGGCACALLGRCILGRIPELFLYDAEGKEVRLSVGLCICLSYCVVVPLRRR